MTDHESPHADVFAFWGGSHSNSSQLIVLTVYADGVAIRGNGLYLFEDILRMVREGKITAVPAGEEVALVGVGEFRMQVVRQARSNDELRTVLLDAYARLHGAPDSLSRCKRALQRYLDSRSAEALTAFRQAYEAVPTLTRAAVLDDMDLKNHPVERLLYGDEHNRERGQQELDTWSRQRAAD